MLRVFYENCDRAGVSTDQYDKGFSIMLGGPAQDYYFENLTRDQGIFEFGYIVYAVYYHFYTSELITAYQLEWNAINLLSIIAKHLDKEKLECLELMFAEILKLQPGIAIAESKDNQMRNKAHLAVIGVSECNLSLYKPAATWQGLCNDLRSAVGTATRSGKRADQFTQYTGHDIPAIEANLTDRLFQRNRDSGRGARPFFRGNNSFRGNSSRDNSSRSSQPYRTKRCYVCNKQGCWSNKHSQEERQQAYARFKTSNPDHNRAFYQHFLIACEGVEEDARVEEEEQLCADVERMLEHNTELEIED